MVLLTVFIIVALVILLVVIDKTFQNYIAGKTDPAKNIPEDKKELFPTTKTYDWHSYELKRQNDFFNDPSYDFHPGNIHYNRHRHDQN